MSVSDRVTYPEAAAILGCHVSNVPKLIRRGLLTSTGKCGASLDRGQVEQLRDRRAETREEQRARPRVDHRPDTVIYGE